MWISDWNPRSPMSDVAAPRSAPARWLAGLFPAFLLCVLAVVRDPGALDSGHVPRLLVLNAGLVIAVLLALTPSIRGQLNWGSLWSGVVYAYAGYAGAVWISLLFASNPSAGLLDACRSGAALVVLCLCVVFFSSFLEWRVWVAKTVVLAALVCGGIGLFQCIGNRVWMSPTRSAMEAITGAMGNVNLFTGYLALILPLCMAAIPVLRGVWRPVAAVAGGNVLFLIVVLQCRSAWISTVAVVVVFFVFVGMRPAAFGLPVRCRGFFAAGAGAGLLAAVLFFVFAPADNPFAFRIRAVFSEDIRFSDGGRLMVWRETLKMIADHFPFGVGAGNFTVHLQGYREGGGLDFSQINSNWNQPHNDYLWIFAEKGVLGMITFMGLLLLGVSAGVQGVFRSQRKEDAWMGAAALAGLAAYMSDSLFSFPLDRVNHQVALAAILAILVVSKNGASPRSPRSGVLPRRLFAIIALGILAVGLPVAWISLDQEQHVRLAREAMERGHWNTMQKHAKLARTPLRTLDAYAVPVSFLEGFALMKKGRRDDAIELFELADAENPNRYYILNNLAILYAERGELEKSRNLFIKLTRHFPEQHEPVINFAVFLLDDGSEAEARRLLATVPNEKIPEAVLEKFSRSPEPGAASGNGRTRFATPLDLPENAD